MIRFELTAEEAQTVVNVLAANMSYRDGMTLIPKLMGQANTAETPPTPEEIQAEADLAEYD